jgi:hypothetical protein
MEKTIFACDFWKDYLWLFILPALLGTFMFIAGIFTLIYAFTISKWIMAVISLFLIFIGQSLMYTLECGLMQKVTINKNWVIYKYPKFYWPFSSAKETFQIKDINSIMLGYFLMSKIFPDKIESLSQSLQYGKDTGFEIIYNKENENIDKKMGLPVIHSQDYYGAIKNLIGNAGLKSSEIGFIFKKDMKI